MIGPSQLSPGSSESGADALYSSNKSAPANSSVRSAERELMNTTSSDEFSITASTRTLLPGGATIPYRTGRMSRSAAATRAWSTSPHPSPHARKRIDRLKVIPPSRQANPGRHANGARWSAILNGPGNRDRGARQRTDLGAGEHDVVDDQGLPRAEPRHGQSLRHV